MEKIFEIHPNKPIPGILPNCKRINETIRLPLTRSEFLKCMGLATVYAVVGENKILITANDYDSAISLFNENN